MIGFIGGSLAKIGLVSARSQIIAISVVVLPLVFFGLVKMWQSDIQEKTRLEVGKELQDKRIETINKGREIDDKIFNSDDADLCAILGGCKLPDNSTD